MVFVAQINSDRRPFSIVKLYNHPMQHTIIQHNTIQSHNTYYYPISRYLNYPYHYYLSTLYNKFKTPKSWIRLLIFVLGKLADRAFSRHRKIENFSRQFYHNWSKIKLVNKSVVRCTLIFGVFEFLNFRHYMARQPTPAYLESNYSRYGSMRRFLPRLKQNFF